MNSHQVRKSRTALASATASHVLGWAAFLWIAFWPYSYQGVSATPVNVDGTGATESVEVRHSASFTEVNGYGPLIPLFLPVLVTGLALQFLLTRRVRQVANALVVWGLSAVLLVFCGLGFLSFGLLYAPAAISLIATAVIFGPGRGLPKLNDE